MKASELIAELQEMMAETAADPEVKAQSAGCCPWAHEINEIDLEQREGESSVYVVIRV